MSDAAVLLVEDNRFDEILTLRLLGKSNYQNVVVARDGAEAFDYLLGTGRFEGRDSSALPKFVLLDLKMPKIDGIALLKMMRSQERLKNVPVIVITSSIEDSDLKLCSDLNVLAYLNKPLTREDLEKTLREHGIA
ncbi:response regulator [Geomonas sp. RF6]|uniref:response regulator n=1 Tax=Geomonas sp. RF6 TaxID=2897342 RepID=UPI001E4BB0D3|nr:response regulator [Geomonas sp. RF6]UFS71125.1 response regulator [Geomonas sp. RF6]